MSYSDDRKHIFTICNCRWISSSQFRSSSIHLHTMKRNPFWMSRSRMFSCSVKLVRALLHSCQVCLCSRCLMSWEFLQLFWHNPRSPRRRPGWSWSLERISVKTLIWSRKGQISLPKQKHCFLTFKIVNEPWASGELSISQRQRSQKTSQLLVRQPQLAIWWVTYLALFLKKLVLYSRLYFADLHWTV